MNHAAACDCGQGFTRRLGAFHSGAFVSPDERRQAIRAAPELVGDHL